MTRYKFFDSSIQTQSDGSSIQWKQAYDIASTFASSGYITGVIEDPNPQLGANLDLNSNNIVGIGGITVSGSISADMVYVNGVMVSITGHNHVINDVISLSGVLENKIDFDDIIEGGFF